MSKDWSQFHTEHTTERGLALFPNLYTPRRFKDKKGQERGDAMFSSAFLFDPDDCKEMKKVLNQISKDAHGVPLKDLKPSNVPLKDGAKEKRKAEANGKNGDFYEGKLVLKTKSKFQPEVVDTKRQEIIDEKKIYSGIVARAIVTFVPYLDNEDEPGITCYLNFFMKVDDGDRLTGRTAKDAFAGIEDGDTDYDPSEGDALDDDDEIPF